MKTTDPKLTPFEAAIKRYLDERAASDPQFATAYAKPGKTLKQCCNFIIAEVRKTSRTAFANEEIYGLAVHYYDEDDLGEIRSAPACRIVTPAESAAAATTPSAAASASAHKRPSAKARKTAPMPDATPSLFDF